MELDFSTFVGQKDIVEQLKISIFAAKKNGVALNHCLFLGPPGLGKTSLANIVSKEMGYNIVNFNPLTTRTTESLYKFLVSIKDNSIVFIDEIHELSRDAAETLYPLMQDGYLHIIEDNQEIKIEFKNLTFIGATTDLSLLPKPLVDRFTFKFYFELYNNEDLTKIIEDYSKNIGMVLNTIDIISVVTRSKGTPRIAKSLVKLIKDDIDYYGNLNTDRVFSRNKIMEYGLDVIDRKILEGLYTRLPVGLVALSSYIGEDKSEIMGRENYLISLGLTGRSAAGRYLTIAGENFVNDVVRKLKV